MGVHELASRVRGGGLRWSPRRSAVPVGSTVAEVRIDDEGFGVVCRVCGNWVQLVQIHRFGKENRYTEHRFDDAFYNWLEHYNSDDCRPGPGRSFAAGTPRGAGDCADLTCGHVGLAL